MKYKIKKMLILTIIGTGISIPSNAQKIYNQQKNSGLQTESLGFQKDQRIWNSNSQKKLKQSLSIFKGSDSSDYADSSNVKGLYSGLFF